MKKHQLRRYVCSSAFDIALLRLTTAQTLHLKLFDRSQLSVAYE